MDLTIRTGDGIFNYRACGLLIHEGKLLVTQVEKDGHFFLPGGRVTFGEQAEAAVLREIREEIGIECRILRTLWLNQAFFTHQNQRFHELCFYFLLDWSGTDLLSRGKEFFTWEGQKENRFLWVPFEDLKNLWFHPTFLKEEIYHLPEQFTLRTEVD